MQTIKTAAVVVLMLTVLYGGYVSLTTPPEPLPDEIGEILVIEEAGGAFGTGDSFASDFGLSQPPPGVLAARASEPAPSANWGAGSPSLRGLCRGRRQCRVR